MKLRIAKKVLKACVDEPHHRHATIARAMRRDGKTEGGLAALRLWKALAKIRQLRGVGETTPLGGLNPWFYDYSA